MKNKKDYTQMDLFFADIVDPNLRDERDTMEHPFFSLSKIKRIKPIEYKKNDVEVIVRGLADVGIATIWDADFLIWIASELNEAVQNGEKISPRLWFHPYKFLVQTKRISPTNKNVGGKIYRDFEKALERLQTTSIKTNIVAGGKRIKEAWHWIDYWQVIEDEKTGKMTGIEVVISEWLYSRIVKDKAVLSIHEDYFLLTGGIDRWLYRIARKHCGNNEMWNFSVKALYAKYPTGREYRFFKRDLKKVVLENSLPEYDVFWIEGEKNTESVMFELRADAKFRRLSPKKVKKEFDKLPSYKRLSKS